MFKNSLKTTLRPACGEDAPQYGRSMIEMLGVLAIIGVLSVGGIAGYSKAMSKYRINKTADQVSQLAQNIRTLYSSQKNYGSLSHDVIKKAHLAPEEMYESTGSNSLINPFGGNVVVYAYEKYSDSDDNKAFIIHYSDIPQEACIELLTMDWGSGSGSGLIAVGTNVGTGDAYYGCRGQAGGAWCASDGVMPVDTAIDFCLIGSPEWRFY